MDTPSSSAVPRAWLLDGRGGAERLDGAALRRWRPADGPLWIDLDATSEPDRAWLASAESVDPHHRELFLRDTAWPRARIPGYEQLILHMRVLLTTPERDGAHGMLRFWIERERVLSMAPPGFTLLRELQGRLGDGFGPSSASALLLAAIESMASSLADAVLELEPDVAEFELALEQEKPPAAHQVRRLRRRGIDLQRHADPHRALLIRLRSLELSWLTKDQRNDWQTVADYYSEGTREVDMIADRARMLEDALANRTSEQMNRRVYLLTLIATLVLPLSLITSLLAVGIGTVEGNVLGLRHPLWFIALCVALGLTGLGIFMFFRRRWLT